MNPSTETALSLKTPIFVVLQYWRLPFSLCGSFATVANCQIRNTEPITPTMAHMT